MGSPGAKALTKALAVNTNLTCLDIGNSLKVPPVGASCVVQTHTYCFP